MVATADIGRTAATELVEGGRGSRIVELAGPQEYTPNDVAEAVSKTVGRPVRAQELPLDAVVPTFTGFGVSPQVAQLFREMFEGMAAGRIAWEGGKARSVHGKVTLEDTLRKLLGR